MGYNDYSYQSRSAKTISLRGMSTDQVFEQNKVGRTHESMLPSKATIREARDSDIHPSTVPIVIALDITSSMGDIPEHLVKEGLPKIISSLMKKGVAHPSVLFMAVGDSRTDRGGTFQVGQFESGDKEMDMWLERMWLRGGGGGNGSESYLWAYHFAKNHVVTDAWEKRKEKGFIFTIGDDHCQHSISPAELKEVMEDNIKGEPADAVTLIKDMQQRWDVFHINLDEPDGTGTDHGRRKTQDSWGQLLGNENVIQMGRRDYQGISDKIADIIASKVTNKDFSFANKEEEELKAVTPPDTGKTQPATPIL